MVLVDDFLLMRHRHYRYYFRSKRLVDDIGKALLVRQVVKRNAVTLRTQAGVCEVDIERFSIG